MSLGRWVSAQWPYLLTAAGGAAVIGIAISTRPTIGPAGSFVPPSTTIKRAWVLLDGTPVRLVKGRRYRGCVQVPFVVPTSLVVDKLGPALLAKGFADIAISRPRPSDWPAVSCDIHVEATWTGESQALDRPGAVSLAWEGSPV